MRYTEHHHRPSILRQQSCTTLARNSRGRRPGSNSGACMDALYRCGSGKTCKPLVHRYAVFRRLAPRPRRGLRNVIPPAFVTLRRQWCNTVPYPGTAKSTTSCTAIAVQEADRHLMQQHRVRLAHGCGHYCEGKGGARFKGRQFWRYARQLFARYCS